MRLYQMSRDARYTCKVHTEMELNGVLFLKQVKDEVKAEVTKLLQAQQQQSQGQTGNT